jgi:hypothetical protein
MANRPLRANDVQVDTIRRAYCRIPGCKWVGEDRSTYNAANDDRQRHLTWHREGQARQLQLEADQAAADLAESGYDREYDPGPEVDDEGGMTKYRGWLP